MQAVILAAGRGARLHPITAKRPKAMLPILGKPIIERVMEGLRENGSDDLIVVTSPDDTQIRGYFHQKCASGANIQFAVQPQRLGMADALQNAARYINGDFILSACDNLFPANDIKELVHLWKTDPGLDAILTTMQVSAEQVSSVGIVMLEGERVIEIIEKPTPEDAPSTIASLPLYIFSKRFLKFLPYVKRSNRGEYELQDAIQMLIDQGGKVLGFSVQDRLTLTHPTDLLQINLHLLSTCLVNSHLEPESVGSGTRLIDPLFIERGIIIGANCTIGPNVYIERNCIIEDEVSMEDAVILRNSVVPKNHKIIAQIFCE